MLLIATRKKVIKRNSKDDVSVWLKDMSILKLENGGGDRDCDNAV